MPDAALVPMALRRPSDWWRLALTALLGSATGGLASYLAGSRLHPGAEAMARLPLVRPSMVRAASAWLQEDGACGVLRQPTSGVPFKVFALVAGRDGLPLGWFLLWAMLARGSRFLAVTLGAAIGGRLLPGFIARHHCLIVLLWSGGFGVGLWRTVVYWSRQPLVPPRSP